MRPLRSGSIEPLARSLYFWACVSRPRSDCCAHYGRLQSAIENLKSQLLPFPVIQRIERGFPNPTGFPSHEGSKIIGNCQKGPIPVLNGHLSGNKWQRLKHLEARLLILPTTLLFRPLVRFCALDRHTNVDTRTPRTTCAHPTWDLPNSRGRTISEV